MATFNVISERAAPPQPKAKSPFAKRMSEYQGFVAGLKKGSVGRLSPAPGETARSVSMRVNRAATRLGRPIASWVSDGVVYFRPGG